MIIIKNQDFKKIFHLFFENLPKLMLRNGIVSEGEQETALRERKEVNSMEGLSSSQRKTVEHQFDSFCKKVLREERRDIIRSMQRRMAKEILFSEMSQQEIDALMTMDKYSSDTNKFVACGFEVDVESDLLAEALSKLPARSREIILLAYFLDMSDVEIAEAMNMVRRTVQYQRSNSLNKLNQYMGGKTNVEE